MGTIYINDDVVKFLAILGIVFIMLTLSLIGVFIGTKSAKLYSKYTKKP